ESAGAGDAPDTAPGAGRARASRRRPAARSLVDRVPGEPAHRPRPHDRPLQPERPEGRQAGHRRFGVPRPHRSARQRAHRDPAAAGGKRRRPGDPGESEFFGKGRQFFASPRASVSVELFQGQTAFKPRTWAFKATGVANLNYLSVEERNLVNVDVREGESRRRDDVSLEEAFAEA